ncbi:MAG: chromosome segregation protein SMC [Corynebacterium sp.]|nr:chromosome segregation protein SMC [Corynebacterium sp.]
MHLKSLTLKGFKSFASATTLKFEPGICAVVGPNGSGKSNVVDALAWVMGEQGAKTLRGNSMQDVIFAGAGSKKPLGRAEVTLTIDNHDGALPIEYREVAITRRMFRDGASEYEINGQRARLLDVQELLSDSGIGREMHVIVGQGRLSQILESRPEERRAFIEEAAGVRKHRRRKDQAHRKLQGMQVNLDRLEDLTGELRRQLKPLARQAEAAQKAATLQAQVRELRGQVAASQLAHASEQVVQAQDQFSQRTTNFEQLNAAVTAAQEAVTSSEAKLAFLEPAHSTAQQQWFELSALSERVVATERIARERQQSFQETTYAGPDPQELEDRLQRAAEEAAIAESELEVATERLETIAEQLDEATESAQEADAAHMAQLQARSDYQAGMAKIASQVEATQQRLEQSSQESMRQREVYEQALIAQQTAHDKLAQYESELATLDADTGERTQQQQIAQAESEQAQQRVSELRDTQLQAEKEVSRLESRIETLSQTLNRTAPTELLETWGATRAVFDAVRVPQGWEKAAAVVMHTIAQGQIVPADFPTLVTAIGDAQLADLNQAVAFSTQDATEPWHLDITLPAYAQWFVELVDIESSLVQACCQLWADVAVVDHLSQAQDLSEQEPRLRVVTRAGVLLGAGWISFGELVQSPVETAAAISQAEAALAEAKVRVDAHAGELAGAQQASEEAQVAHASAQAKLRDHEHSLHVCRREVERAQGELAKAQKQARRATDAQSQAEQREAQLRTELSQLRERLGRVEQEDEPEAPVSTDRDAAMAMVTQIQAMHMEARLQVRTLEERLQQAQGRQHGLERQLVHERQAAAQYEQRVRKQRQLASHAQFVQLQAANLLERLRVSVQAAAETRDTLQEQLRAQQAFVQTQRQEHQRVTQQANAAQKQMHNAEVHLSQVQVRLEELAESAQQQLGLPLADILASYELPADFALEQARSALSTAERKLQALGKVNPLALEEYKALEERYEYLSQQLADVHQARADLQQVIADVEAHILQLFSNAWRDVEAEFPKVFATLFPGGEGRLVLTDPGNLETTGIDIEARPPGKRIKRLTLLSGGEKSLTALAMLVAIFRARPSPFYVMDEVEAALDDVNLRRLLALFAELREESQLIVITHQKPTMNLANVLYGVTMRGDGVTRVVSQRMQEKPASDAVPELPKSPGNGADLGDE